jgi:hypothetical protein
MHTKEKKEESSCKYTYTQYQQKTTAVCYTNNKKVRIKDTFIAWSKTEGELLQNVHVYSVYSKNTNQLYITLYDPYQLYITLYDPYQLYITLYDPYQYILHYMTPINYILHYMTPINYILHYMTPIIVKGAEYLFLFFNT